MSRPERVILLVVDGMRPDGLLQADAPAMHRMIERGAFSPAAQTVMPSVSLPTHMSMFHSLLPDDHGVITNMWEAMPGAPVPGIMDLAHLHGLKTASFHTWEPLRDLARPGSLTFGGFLNIYGNYGAEIDMAIARLAADCLTRERPDFTFIYLGWTDEAAHKNSWMSPAYLDAIAGADNAIAHVMDRLDQAGMLESTAFLVQADHGGHDRRHGDDIPEDMTIPWILSGAGVRSGVRLNGAVSILDTAPTIATLLKLPAPEAWQGRSVVEALEG